MRPTIVSSTTCVVFVRPIARFPSLQASPRESTCADRDLFFLLGNFGWLRQPDPQNAFFELRLDLRGIRIVRKRDGPAERTVAALNHVPVLVLVGFVAFRLFLAADGQNAVRKGDIDVLFVDAR